MLRELATTAFLGWLAHAAAQFKMREQVVDTWDTLFGQARVVDTYDAGGRPIRVLEVEGTWQSAIYLDAHGQPDCGGLVFPYHRIFEGCLACLPAMQCAGGDAGPDATWPRVLVLGGGGYAFPAYLACRHPGLGIDVAELDPAITQIARTYFLADGAQTRFGDNPPGQGPEVRLRNFRAPGRAFLENAGEYGAPHVRYQAIFNDCFGAGTPDAPLATLEGVCAARSRLSPGGIYVANVVSARKGRRARPVQNVVATLGQAFSHVYVMCATDAEASVEDNIVVLATDSGQAFPGARDYPDARLGTVLHDGPGG